MIVFKIILFTLATALVSFAVGNAVWHLLYKWLGKSDGIGNYIFVGATVSVALGAVVYCLAGIISMPVRIAFVILIFALAFIVLAGMINCKRHKRRILGDCECKDSSINNREYVICLVPIVLIAIQLFVVIKWMPQNSFTMSKIPVATSVYETGIASGQSALMSLWGTLALLFNVHPLIFIYTILPIASFAYYYLGYYMLFNRYIGKDVKKIVYALTAVAILNIWGYQSNIQLLASVMMSWFAMPCFIINGVCVCVVVVATRYLDNIGYEVLANRKDKKTAQESSDLIDDDEYQEEWDMKKHKIINARNLAIAWAVLAVMLVGFVFVLNNKINDLHASTANLQRDLDNRCRIYEFTAADGISYGYLIKDKDGSLTMIGGGDEDRADDLFDFVNEYGSSIKNWYLYDSSPENVGAYFKCTSEKGINVENTYVLNRMEINGL